MPTTSQNIRYKMPRKGHANAYHLSVKFEDLCGFMVEGNVDDVNVLNEVRERIREQARVWWALEASKGANWYLQPRVSSNGTEGLIRVTSLKLSVLTNSVTLRRLIRKGVPPALRPKVWLSVSGAAKKRSTVPETYYDELIRITEGKTTPATRQIDHDLPRTFPCHPWLNSEEEEDAFWMLAVLLENVLVSDCYTDTLTGCHVEQRVFKDLLAKNCPRIAAHLERMGFDVSLVATEWFLCLFSKTLPSETTLRVWDVLFNEGAKVLFHVALAIFKMREDDLLRIQHIGDVIDVLQTTAHHLYEPDELLTFAFDKIGSMTTNTITKERKKQETVVMAELDQRTRRLNSLKMDA
ncbi:unnamed protein product [Alopecurus aequalis]